MTAATYQLEESSPRRGLLTQIAITILLGIPMTLALVVALAFYCTYECIKFALSARSKNQQTPLSIPHEQTFTASLTNFAGIHGPSQQVDIPRQEAPAAEKEQSPEAATYNNIP